MSRKKELFDDFLLYEPKNLKETVKHSVETNRFLHDKTQSECELLFLNEVLKSMKVNDKNPENYLGQLKSVYGAFYIVDRHNFSSQTIGGKTYGPGTFEVNFFVRLGREII